MSSRRGPPLTTRTTTRTFDFARPFSLFGFGARQPAGRYIVETDDEDIEAVSFVARRRTSTRLRLAPDPSRPGLVETLTLDPAEVDALLAQGIEAPAAG